MADKQRGISMSGFLVAVVVLILVVIAGLNIAPPLYSEPYHQ